MKKNRKHLLITLCLMLVVCVISIGGTLAWLTDSTDTVKNTFTPTDINVEISETGATDTDGDKTFEKSFEMVPGATIAKDPKVTVKANSQACYVFVQIDKSTNFDAFNSIS